MARFFFAQCILANNTNQRVGFCTVSGVIENANFLVCFQLRESNSSFEWCGVTVNKCITLVLLPIQSIYRWHQPQCWSYGQTLSRQMSQRLNKKDRSIIKCASRLWNAVMLYHSLHLDISHYFVHRCVLFECCENKQIKASYERNTNFSTRSRITFISCQQSSFLV